MKKNFLGIFGFLISLLFLSSFILAEKPPVATWWGTFTLDGNSSTDGEQITAYVNGVEKVSATVGEQTSGYYILDVPCTDGQEVVFKYCDIIASTETCNQGIRTELNLDIHRLKVGEKCINDCSCSSNYCSYGVCKTPQYPTGKSLTLPAGITNTFLILTSVIIIAISIYLFKRYKIKEVKKL